MQIDVLINGSSALKYFGYDFPREPEDLDGFLRGKNNVLKGKIGADIYDFKGIPSDIFDVIKRANNFQEYLKPNLLYTVKLSHSFFDVNWDKTMSDIEWMQENFNEEEKKIDEEVFNKLYNFWLDYHVNNKDKINLNVGNEEFFSNKVDYDFNHDDLHEMVKYYDEPLYKKIKEDPSKANVDYRKFKIFNDEEKLNLAREEISVIALERFLLKTKSFMTMEEFKHPFSVKEGNKAWYNAAKKLITTMSKGWFPKFIVSNWKDLNKPDYENYYVDKFFKEKDKWNKKKK